MDYLVEFYQDLLEARDIMVGYTRMRERVENCISNSNRAVIAHYDCLIKKLENKIVITLDTEGRKVDESIN